MFIAGVLLLFSFVVNYINLVMVLGEYLGAVRGVCRAVGVDDSTWRSHHSSVVVVAGVLR